MILDLPCDLLLGNTGRFAAVIALTCDLSDTGGAALVEALSCGNIQEEAERYGGSFSGSL